jgi:hypothetical protein
VGGFRYALAVLGLLRRLAPALHLTRVTTAFALVANTWFVILWSRAAAAHEDPAGPPGRIEHGPLWALLGGGALVALGLFGFGAALNDILDVKRDRTLRPDRPLVSGQISMEAALTLVFLTMIAAVLGAAVFGTEAVVMTALVLGAIFLFNAVGRFIPAVGLVVLGLIHAGYMLIPNVHLRFLWPVWLAMTHSLAVGAVTYRLGQKVPKISRRAWAAAIAGWMFWSGVTLWLQWERDPRPRSLWPEWLDPWPIVVWPAGLALVFTLVAWGKARGAGTGARAAEKVSRYGALWLALYACGWLVGAGHRQESLILLALAGCSFLGMTVLREVYGLVEQPMGYRL